GLRSANSSLMLADARRESVASWHCSLWFAEPSLSEGLCDSNYC
ncbi:hypothetical protein L195_g063301, partial [Trifolium pratense]